MQQSRAYLTDINLSHQLPPGTDGSRQLAEVMAVEMGNLAHWISIYAGTVRSITLDYPDTVALGAASLRFKRLAHQVLALGLRSAAAANRTATAPASGSVACDMADMSPPLQLQKFECCSSMASTLVLSALPAASLTRLRVIVPQNEALHAAISGLSNLQSLSLFSQTANHRMDSYFSIINKLKHLTLLQINCVQGASSLSFLPQQVSELGLHVTSGDEPSVHLDFSHLTGLQALNLNVRRSVAAADLPQQLQSMQLTCLGPAVSTFNLTSLSQLHTLNISSSRDSPADLLKLQHMQQLSELHLGYTNGDAAVAATAVWSKLQHLKGLQFELPCIASQMASIIQAISLLTELTRLKIDSKGDEVVPAVDDVQADQQAMTDAMTRMRRICHSLRHLTSLKSLQLDLHCWVALQQDDLQHLSHLNGVTRLSLNVKELKDRTSAIAMLLELTQLQHLALWNIDDLSVLPVVGKLCGLTYLSLRGLPPNAQHQGLKHLTRLRNLQKLSGFGSCSKEVMKKFWSRLRS